MTSSRKSRVYEIHDNGGTPFLVDVKGMEVEIYTQDELDDDDFYFSLQTWRRHPWYQLNEKTYAKDIEGRRITYTHWKTYRKCQEIFIGKDTGRFGSKDTDGNSILVRRSKNVYLYIGSEVFTFVSTDPVKEYYSPIGNSDVPYPFAITESGAVLLTIEGGSENIILIDPIKNLRTKLRQQFDYPYLVYYGHVEDID